MTALTPNEFYDQLEEAFAGDPADVNAAVIKLLGTTRAKLS
jgi:hypothetical protein